MPKKKIKQDEYVADTGLILDAAQAAMVRKQIHEGSYSLGAPTVAITADDAVATVKFVAYTVHGDSRITTIVSYTPEDAVDGYRPYVVPSLQDLVSQAMEGARTDAEAVIEAVNEEWEANVGDVYDKNEDEGLREGPVVGGSLGSAAEADDEAVPSIAELKRRKAFAETLVASLKASKARCTADLVTVEEARRRSAVAWALVAEEKAAEIVGDTIRIPNSEYADLLAAKRKGEFAIAQLESFPVVGRVFLKSGVVTLRTTSEGLASLDAAIATFPVDAFWRRSCGTASDVSDSTQDDGGPVEPELDIDALVAAVDVQRDTCSLDIRAVRSTEYPALTVTVTGAGSADLVRRILSEIHLPTLTEPLVNVRPVQVDVGEFAATSVDPVADVAAFCRAVRARI